MGNLSPEQVAAAKARGFLRNRGTDRFSGRVVCAGGVYTPRQLAHIGECAKLFGNGKIAFTSRLAAEIVGIPFDDIENATAFLRLEPGLVFGGTGPKIRPITACKGTTCVFGRSDTQGLALKLHEAFYLGWSHIQLPHKFKIGIGGCPNSCMKPNLNDFGLEACRLDDGVGYIVYVGGTWGRKIRIGTELSRSFKEEEIPDLLVRALNWYIENGEKKERFGTAIERLGIGRFERDLGI